MQKIQVGIIGLGGIGRQFLAEMQAHDRFTVVVAWDPSQTARATGLGKKNSQALPTLAMRIGNERSTGSRPVWPGSP